MMATIGVKIKVIIPKAVMDYGRVRDAIENTMATKTRSELRREFERTVRTWDHQPNWSSELYRGVRVMWVKVYTYSTQYRLVNAGAKPHIIRKRNAPLLRYQTGFRAKSRPRVVGSFAGGKYGSWRVANAVHHPGHEAREFDKEIAEEYQDTFRKDIQEAITEGILHK